MSHEDKHCISIFVNNICNMDCSYCYAKLERTHDNSRIDIEFAKTGIKDYFDQGYHYLRFFGTGEPTLDIDLIKELVDYARQLVGNKLVTEIQTNGVMPTDVATWLGANISNIWVSWDGMPEIHDKHRKTPAGIPTSAIIEQNVAHMLQEKCQSDNLGFVGARPTITREALYRQKEMIDYFASAGIKYINSAPVIPPLRETAELDSDNEIDLIEFAKEYLKAYEYACSKGIFYGNFLIVNFDKPCTYHCRACLPTPHLTHDGYVSCCDLGCSNQCMPFMRDLLYGYWDADARKIVYDLAQAQKIRTRQFKHIPECSTCEIAPFCGGYCMGEVINQTGDFYGVIPKRCEAIKYLAKNMPIGKVSIPVSHP